MTTTTTTPSVALGAIAVQIERYGPPNSLNTWQGGNLAGLQTAYRVVEKAEAAVQPAHTAPRDFLLELLAQCVDKVGGKLNEDIWGVLNAEGGEWAS